MGTNVGRTNPERLSQFGLFYATRKHEVGIGPTRLLLGPRMAQGEGAAFQMVPILPFERSREIMNRYKQKTTY